MARNRYRLNWLITVNAANLEAQMESGQQKNANGGSDIPTPGMAQGHLAIKGFPGRSRTVVGKQGTLYISGYIETVDADNQLLSVLERCSHQPTELAAHIPILSGHYALAFVTNDLKNSYLITNRYGSEPIYYAKTPGGYSWSFAITDMLSELAERSIDERGLDEITRYRWLTEDRTLISGVIQVLPGHMVLLGSGQSVKIAPYTRVEFRPSSKVADQNSVIRDTNEALDQYLSGIRRVHSHIAILFSGGVDSSLLVAKARDHNFDRVLAVSAGFPGRPNPEVERATAIAKHLGVEHRIIDVPDEFVANSLTRIISQLERPSPYENNFARSRIFEKISSEVNFALTGEGADGMFGGSDAGKIATAYDAEQRFIAWIPWKTRFAIARAMSSFDSPLLRRLHRYLTVGTRQFIREKGTLETVGRTSSIGAIALIPQLGKIRAKYTRPFYSIYEPENPKSIAAICQNRAFHSQNRNQFYCYSKLASPYGISVGHPFVAPEMAEIGLTLSDAMKWDELGTKPILKKLACRYIPSEWIYAKKLGFETPYLEWLRGPLKPMVEMLFEPRTLSRGLFDEKILRALDLTRDRDLIWTAINLELFAREFLDE